MVTNLSDCNSILCGWMLEIRDKSIQADRMRFRKNMERIGEICAYEISKTLAYKQVEIQTPISNTQCFELAEQPVLATILRAGLPLHQGLLNYFDKADNAFVGSYRKHNSYGSFDIDHQYITSPSLAGRVLIVSDPMLATGSSLILALDKLTEFEKPAQIHIVTAIACSVGLDLLERRYPHINIWAGVIDNDLTENGYIIPGLGDAGDLSYGNKIQN